MTYFHLITLVHFSGWILAVHVRGGPVQHGTPAPCAAVPQHPCGTARLCLLGARGGAGDERRAAGRWPLAAGGQGGGRHPAAAKADGDSARHGGIGVTPVCRKMAGIWILGRVWLRGPCVAESFRLKVRLRLEKANRPSVALERYGATLQPNRPSPFPAYQSFMCTWLMCPSRTPPPSLFIHVFV